MGVFFRPSISRRAKTIFLPQFASRFSSPKVAKNRGLGVVFFQKRVLLQVKKNFEMGVLCV
jgi:hypothetical protein